MDIPNIIKELFSEALETIEADLTQELTADSVLLDSGLNSLGFAILVSRLEEELDVDPFAEMEDAVYPKTYSEFVKIYQDALEKA